MMNWFLSKREVEALELELELGAIILETIRENMQ